jgi:hypothetical protein
MTCRDCDGPAFNLKGSDPLNRTIGKHYKPYKDKGYRAFPYEKHLIYYVESSFGITLIHIDHESMNQVQYLDKGGNS